MGLVKMFIEQYFSNIQMTVQVFENFYKLKRIIQLYIMTRIKVNYQVYYHHFSLN